LGEVPIGPHNDITDVAGVTVGHVSLIWGEGPLVPGRGPVRTGITAIKPSQRNLYREPCRAGLFILNGYGKSLGTPFIRELGILNCPVLLTNTLSVPAAAEGLLTYILQQNPEIGNDARTANLVVFECDDSYLNDMRGRHVRPSDAVIALQRAGGGPIAQGNIGAGVGMSCFQLKGGIGSSSRLIELEPGRRYTLGILVLANFGLLRDLHISGVPVGRFLLRYIPGLIPESLAGTSLIIVGITDAPLTVPQLERLARRSALGQARTGSISMTGSGDFCLMISTAPLTHGESVADWAMDDFYRAVSEATAEAIWNALFLAETMIGRDDRVRYALPIAETLEIMSGWRGGLPKNREMPGRQPAP